ncbi:MAG: response regulator transcription factor [Ferruginibacter sp.]
MYKILLADAHPVVRTGLKFVVEEFNRSTEIHEVSNGDEIIAKLKKDKFDLIIMDIRMPGTDALDIVQFIKMRYKDTKVLIFTSSPEELYASRLIKEGVNGFISKNTELDELKKAIQLVLNGRIYISEKLMERLAYDSFSNKPLNPFSTLSTREFEVASRILSGECLTDIANSLQLHQSTVGTHKARLYEKLNVGNILQLKDLASFYGVI